jgi:Glycosyl transferases group 1/Glycosyltransferase Family 4
VLIHAATDNDIHPPRSGATQRTFGLLRGLARRADVRALCVVPNRSRGAARESAGGVSLVRRRAWYTGLAWRLDRFGLAPMLVAARGHRASAASLLRALEGEADVFAADLLLTPLFARHAAPVKVYTAHNVELDHFRETHASLGSSHRWMRELEALERQAIEQSSLIVACTPEDAARFTELYGVEPGRLALAPNGWDETRVSAATPDSRAHARRRLGLEDRGTIALFVGSDVPHNREAVRALCRDVAPALAAQGATLLVVGSAARAVASPAAAAVRAFDEVDDLLPYLHAADVGLNPVSAGGGSNVKLPTYLAAGLAVVTTSFGLRGFAALAPHVIECTVERMPEALRERPAGWASRGEAMPAGVAELAWGRIGERLAARFETTLATSRIATAEGAGA